MTTESQRCGCAECRELDLLPVELQGCPGGYQLTMFPLTRRPPPPRRPEPDRYYPTRKLRDPGA